MIFFDESDRSCVAWCSQCSWRSLGIDGGSLRPGAALHMKNVHPDQQNTPRETLKKSRHRTRHVSG